MLRTTCDSQIAASFVSQMALPFDGVVFDLDGTVTSLWGSSRNTTGLPRHEVQAATGPGA